MHVHGADNAHVCSSKQASQSWLAVVTKRQNFQRYLYLQMNVSCLKG